MGIKKMYNYESRNEFMKLFILFYRRGNEVKSKGLFKVIRILEYIQDWKLGFLY